MQQQAYSLMLFLLTVAMTSTSQLIANEEKGYTENVYLSELDEKDEYLPEKEVYLPEMGGVINGANFADGKEYDQLSNDPLRVILKELIHEMETMVNSSNWREIKILRKHIIPKVKRIRRRCDNDMKNLCLKELVHEIEQQTKSQPTLPYARLAIVGLTCFDHHLVELTSKCKTSIQKMNERSRPQQNHGRHSRRNRRNHKKHSRRDHKKHSRWNHKKQTRHGYDSKKRGHKYSSDSAADFFYRHEANTAGRSSPCFDSQRRYKRFHHNSFHAIGFLFLLSMFNVLCFVIIKRYQRRTLNTSTMTTAGPTCPNPSAINIV